jgi:hypothetical protein
MVKVDLHADIAERCNEVGLVGFHDPDNLLGEKDLTVRLHIGEVQEPSRTRMTPQTPTLVR